MIIDLPSTTTAAVNRRLVDLRDTGGAVALGRVLTLIIVTTEQDAEPAIDAANAASREHPCRVIAVVRSTARGADRMDAQIRVGGDAGASEVIVLRLYGRLTRHGDSVVTPLLLADSPVVAWWPGPAPTDVANEPIGRMAQRRITDAAAATQPLRELTRRRDAYAIGDTDLAWTRITRWRGLLAAALDQPPYQPVVRVTVSGAVDSPSTDLLTAWLATALRCPVTRARTRRGTGMFSVRLERRGGPIDLVRADGTVATLTQPGQPDRRISLPRRDLAECLSEELRRLDPDEIYRATLLHGVERLAEGRTMSASQAAREGGAMPVRTAQAQARTAARREAAHARAIDEATPQDGRPAKTTRKKTTPRKATVRKTTPSRAPRKKATPDQPAGQQTSATRATGEEAP